MDGILALVLVGLDPLAAGVFNVCLLGPFFKALCFADDADSAPLRLYRDPTRR